MKKKITLLLMAIACSFSSFAQASSTTEDKIKVYVHEPVELLLTMYYLTPKGQKFKTPHRKDRAWINIMVDPLLSPFHSYNNHPGVAALQKLCTKYKEWLPLMVNIGILNKQMPLDPDLFQPEAETDYANAVRNFIQLANEFYVDSQFDKTFKERAAIYAGIEAEVKQYLPQNGFIEAMETFYQEQFLSYNLCPSPLLPAGNGMGFGPSRDTPKGKEVFNVFSGLDQPDVHPTRLVKENATFGFNNEGWIRGICTHEFGHSFVNPPLSNYRSQFAPYQSLRNPIRRKMKRQAYWHWETILAEHLVRLGEIRIADRLGLEEVRNDLYYDNYVNRKFVYLPHLLEVFRQYEELTTYATFKDFLPTVVSSLAQIDRKKVKRNWKKAKRLNKSQVTPPIIEVIHP